MDDLPIVHQFSTCFSVTISRKKGKNYSDFAEKSPCGAITNSEVTATNSLFLCWLAHLVGFNSGPNIFRRYEQVRFTAILGDYPESRNLVILV